MTPSPSNTQTHQDFAILRRTEGAALGVAATLIFAHLNGNWWFFAGLLLLPDIAMLGYLAGPRFGAYAYNTLHTYVLPVGLGLTGWVWDVPLLLATSAIWMAHIGFDRALGYGLKYTSGFKHTHLSRMQKP